MFSDVVTFTNIAAACPPEKIVNMLNDMYERFDNATTRWDVYKVTRLSSNRSDGWGGEGGEGGGGEKS